MPKYHPCFDTYLREILERDRTGFILILQGHSQQWNHRLSQRIKKILGQELASRIRFLSRLSFQEYYRYISAATVVLHSPVFSGEITSVDCFLFGIPYVTQIGDRLVQQYSAAYYREFGIEGPVVTNKQDYIEQAVKLGTNIEYRNTTSRQILKKQNSFFENEKTIKEWERFLDRAVSKESSQVDPQVLNPSVQNQ